MANSYNVENLIETLNALKQDKILRERRYYETKQKRRRAVAEAEQAEMVLRQVNFGLLATHRSLSLVVEFHTNSWQPTALLEFRCVVFLLRQSQQPM